MTDNQELEIKGLGTMWLDDDLMIITSIIRDDYNKTCQL